MVNKLGQLLALGGAVMAAILDHLNSNAAAYSVMVGFLGLAISGVYTWRKDRREAKLAKAELEAINRRRQHLVTTSQDKENAA